MSHKNMCFKKAGANANIKAQYMLECKERRE
jgi:hypothetical protein